MHEASYLFLVERLAQCEELAQHARDRSVREKAGELARGYRDMISEAEGAIGRASMLPSNDVSQKLS